MAAPLLLLLTAVAASPLRDAANDQDEIGTTVAAFADFDEENAKLATTAAPELLPQIKVRMTSDSSEDKEKERTKKSDQLCYTVSFLHGLFFLDKFH